MSQRNSRQMRPILNTIYLMSQLHNFLRMHGCNEAACDVLSCGNNSRGWRTEETRRCNRRSLNWLTLVNLINIVFIFFRGSWLQEQWWFNQETISSYSGIPSWFSGGLGVTHDGVSRSIIGVDASISVVAVSGSSLHIISLSCTRDMYKYYIKISSHICIMMKASLYLCIHVQCMHCGRNQGYRKTPS